MKLLSLSKQILALILCWSTFAQAAEYNYADLQMKNFEEMQSRINARMKKAEAASNTNVELARSTLKDALQLILARPNPDNMVSQLVPPVRTLLRNLEVYESTLNEIVSSAINQATNQKVKPGLRATQLIALNNFMSEFKPEIKNSEKMRKIFAMIRDAKIKVAEDIKTEMHLRSGLHAPQSPSDIADKILAEK